MKPLRIIYTIDRQDTSSQAIISRNVTLLISSTDLYLKMALSISANAVFLLSSNRNVVPVLSATNGQNMGQLKYDFEAVFYGNNTPSSLVFCTHHDDVMNVGHKTNLISVFKLIHNPL